MRKHKEEKIMSPTIKKHKAALRAALPHTIPILSGFIVLGSAYGILMNSQGVPIIWTAFSSIFVYAGSMQFVAVTLLAAGFDLIGAFLMTLMVNARHLFYGISFLQKYGNMGALKPYMIFSLTDETFSLICSVKPPDKVSTKWFYFYISLLNHMYWVIGSVLGGILGGLLRFETRGLDFVLTALFVVIFMDQWKSTKNHIPAIIGVSSGIICRFIFGSSTFIIPSMALILISVTLFKRPIERRNLR